MSLLLHLHLHHLLCYLPIFNLNTLFIHFLFFNNVLGGDVPSIIVFGDSTVDAGNNNQLHSFAKSNFRPYGRDFEGGKPTGRFCNGRLTTDFLSESFGIKPNIPAYLDPAYSIKDFATGVTFASSGTGYDNITAQEASVIPLWKELVYFKQYQKDLVNFLGRNKATNTLQEALYVMSLGSNDFIENYFVNPQRPSQFTVDQYKNFLLKIAENFITKLYGLGARKIALFGLPPLGCLPVIRFSNVGRACRDGFNDLAKDFNGKYVVLVKRLRRELKGIRLVFSDGYGPALQVIMDPTSYGFEVAAESCCGTGTFELGFLCYEPFTCPDASKYVFWDAVHPTEKLYQYIANSFMNTSLLEFV